MIGGGARRSTALALARRMRRVAVFCALVIACPTVQSALWRRAIAIGLRVLIFDAFDFRLHCVVRRRV